DIPTAKLAAGNYGPSNQKVKPKIRALMQDLNRWADHYGVPFAFPSGMVGKRVNAGTFYAIDRGQVEEYVVKVFHELWGVGGQDANDDAFLSKIATELGWDAEEFLAFVSSEEAGKRFEQSRVKAHSVGVYGAPMMLLDEQIWWGNDRLMFLEEYLQSHPA
ncbi:MAG: DsbA family protein, partial [Gammaproteobacteria bacterium]